MTSGWKEWWEPGRRWLSLFLAVAMLVGGVLIWLGAQWVRQDRELARQRLLERREFAADRASSLLRQSLAGVEEQLAHLTRASSAEAADRAGAIGAGLPADSVLVVDRKDHVETHPRGRLPFYPVVPATAEPVDAVFSAADRAELQAQAYPQALDALRERAASQSATIRAAALLRIGRLQRKLGRPEEAVATYQALLETGSTVAGLPAALVARQQRLRIFQERQQLREARSEAGQLLRLLTGGEFPVQRGAYEFYLAEGEAVAGGSDKPAINEAAFALAACLEILHADWIGEGRQGGRRLLVEDGRPVLALWKPTEQGVIGLLLGPAWIARQFEPELRAMLDEWGLAIRLSDTHGRTIFGPASVAPGRDTVRLASTTQLPWHVHAVLTDPERALSPSRQRQNLMLASLAVIAALVLAASYLMGRTISREFALSRLQSDFVSAVSHEFRTPLTSLCLLSEQLASGRAGTEADYQQYFEVLCKESQRLRRLVEGLLNFGRMEAGAAKYCFETVDPAELVQSVSREFAADPGARGYRIEISAAEDTPLMRADRAALTCAVWNLLDNAVKYSPSCQVIWAEVAGAGGGVSISIRDRGLGIAPAEQRQILRKFVRGKAAKEHSIRGTGVGLAMVQHIVQAHGGDLRVESQEGQGSEFLMRFPGVH